MDETHKIAAIVGITEAVKQYGLPSEFCPTVAIVVGGIIGYTENHTLEGAFAGVLLGATVTGGYAVAKRGGRGVMSTFGSVSVQPTKVPAPPSYNPTPFSDLEHDDYRGV